MEFSARFIREMTRPFYDAQPLRFNSRDTSNPITLDSNNMFSKSLVVDTTGELYCLFIQAVIVKVEELLMVS